GGASREEPLFNKVVATLAGERTADAALQTQLGDAYSYFARWPEAEQAYLASLALKDDESIREQLAWALLKQDRPDDARPCLQHVIDKQKAESAGMVFCLVNGYQAQGRHEEALEVMDQRDQAFPQHVAMKEYQKQRQASTRFRGTQKKVRSTVLDARGQTGY